MDKKEIGKKKRRLKWLQRKLAVLGPVMRGSVVKLATKCGKPTCRCNRGQKHVQTFFSLNKGGRTKLIYLGQSRIQKATELSRNYKRLEEIAEEITLICMELLKAKALD